MFIQFANITTGIWLSILLLGVPSTVLTLWGFVQWLHPSESRFQLSRREDEHLDGMRFSLFLLLPTIFIWFGLLSVVPWWLIMILYSFAIAVVGIVSMVVVLCLDRMTRAIH